MAVKRCQSFDAFSSDPGASSGGLRGLSDRWEPDQLPPSSGQFPGLDDARPAKATESCPSESEEQDSELPAEASEPEKSRAAVNHVNGQESYQRAMSKRLKLLTDRLGLGHHRRGKTQDDATTSFPTESGTGEAPSIQQAPPPESSWNLVQPEPLAANEPMKNGTCTPSLPKTQHGRGEKIIQAQALKIDDSFAAALGPFIPLSMRTVVETTVKLSSPTELFDRVMSDDARGFWHDFHKTCGDSVKAPAVDFVLADLICSTWEREELFSCWRRTLSFRHPIHYVIGPKSVLCHQVQRYKVFPDGHLVVHSEQLMPDLPFGDYFSVHARWDIKPVSSTTCSVEISVEVPFSKKTMLKGRIEQGALDESHETYEAWMKQVKAILDAEVCVLVNSREIRGGTLLACLAALRKEQNIHPELKAEAEGIVAALESAGFQGLQAPGQLSKPGGRAPFTLGSVWQSIWLSAGSLGQTPAIVEERVTSGDGVQTGEVGEGSAMLLEAGAAKGAPSRGGVQRWASWAPAVAWLALFLPVLFICSTTWKLSSEVGSWRADLAGRPSI